MLFSLSLLDLFLSEFFRFFAVLCGLKIIFQLKSDHTKEINIDLEYGFPNKIYSNIIGVALIFGK